MFSEAHWEPGQQTYSKKEQNEINEVLTEVPVKLYELHVISKFISTTPLFPCHKLFDFLFLLTWTPEAQLETLYFLDFCNFISFYPNSKFCCWNLPWVLPGWYILLHSQFSKTSKAHCWIRCWSASSCTHWNTLHHAPCWVSSLDTEFLKFNEEGIPSWHPIWQIKSSGHQHEQKVRAHLACCHPPAPRGLLSLSTDICSLQSVRQLKRTFSWCTIETQIQRASGCITDFRATLVTETAWVLLTCRYLWQRGLQPYYTTVILFIVTDILRWYFNAQAEPCLFRCQWFFSPLLEVHSVLSIHGSLYFN